MKIQSETLGKHESLGDTNSSSSHSFWDLEVMKHLDLLNSDVIKDPGMESLRTHEAVLCIYTYTPVHLFWKNNWSRHCFLNCTCPYECKPVSAEGKAKRNKWLVTGECQANYKHRWYENTYVKSATNPRAGLRSPKKAFQVKCYLN